MDAMDRNRDSSIRANPTTPSWIDPAGVSTGVAIQTYQDQHKSISGSRDDPGPGRLSLRTRGWRLFGMVTLGADWQLSSWEADDLAEVAPYHSRKRAMDVTLASVASLLLLPLAAIVAALV